MVGSLTSTHSQSGRARDGGSDRSQASARNPARASNQRTGGAHKSPAHVPALDGVRGLAILLVLFFHFMILRGDSPIIRLIQKTWGYGWAGVDLFFVLSGFLITGILLDAKGKIPSAGTFYKNFYARRTVRIFPLYYAFLVVFLLILPAVLPSFHQLFGSPPCGQWPYWTYTYNLFQGHHQPEKSFSHALGVTWSLCIEEQFYLIWPTVVWFCKPRSLVKICLGLIVMSIASRALINHYSGYEVFVSQWTFARMDPLAIGAVIAILTRINPNLIARLRGTALQLLWILPLILVGLNLNVGSLIHSSIFRVIGYTVLAVLFGAVLLVTITSSPSGAAVRFFSNSILRLFGRLSYAIYLFNQPVKYVLRRYVLGLKESTEMITSVSTQLYFFVAATIATVALAWLSWHLFEKHFLKIKEWFPMDRPVTIEESNTTDAPMPSAP